MVLDFIREWAGVGDHLYDIELLGYSDTCSGDELYGASYCYDKILHLVVFSAVQTGHLVSVARERSTEFSEQRAVPSPLARNDVCPCVSHQPPDGGVS